MRAFVGKRQMRPFDTKPGIIDKHRDHTLKLMHCPYCSADLVETTGGELRCSLSGALFSAAVREQFETLALKGPSLTCKSAQFRLGRWFCPSCGKETDNGVCGKCGLMITGRLARQLLELNPHERN
ncbi:hypothetical protein LGN17_25235 [Burkholderia sp. AU30280]|uniref:hypothetical protein n=1 Tax=Burkholderia sp. AU30280 TaxID=2879628 RepID=UPI001CF0ED73|nr:hypothetical protein [Burkholderia sp. AU30280]MCA8275788.1 hypothetical protein [Burkholderia sp. AU30280]